MKKLSLILIGALLMSACTSESSYHKISAQEAKEMMDTQESLLWMCVRKKNMTKVILRMHLIPNETANELQLNFLIKMR